VRGRGVVRPFPECGQDYPNSLAMVQFALSVPIESCVIAILF